MSYTTSFLICAALLSGCGDALQQTPVSLKPFGESAAAAGTRGTLAEIASPSIALPAPTYPAYSSYFTGSTPFHMTAASLLAAGANVLPAIYATNFWSQGLGNDAPIGVGGGGESPFYVSSSGDPAYAFQCPEYGGCPIAGKVIHLPAYAVPAPGPDHHLTSFDSVYAGGETDGWGGYYGAAPGCTASKNPQATPACPHPCELTAGNPGKADCAYGGFSRFSGSGLGSGGNAAGYAFGLFEISAQDLLQGHIDHALGINASCLDDNGVYPAPPRGTDTACGSIHVAEPDPSYGHMIHLKSTVIVASYGYSPYCAIVVQALQTYGAYTYDTNGGYGVGIAFEVPTNPLYGTNTPWTNIYRSMADGGDGAYDGPGGSFSFHMCLQRIPASDIEIVQIPNVTSNPGPLGYLPI